MGFGDRGAAAAVGGTHGRNIFVLVQLRRGHHHHGIEGQHVRDLAGQAHLQDVMVFWLFTSTLRWLIEYDCNNMMGSELYRILLLALLPCIYSVCIQSQQLQELGGYNNSYCCKRFLMQCPSSSGISVRKLPANTSSWIELPKPGTLTCTVSSTMGRKWISTAWAWANTSSAPPPTPCASTLGLSRGTPST